MEYRALAIGLTDEFFSGIQPFADCQQYAPDSIINSKGCRPSANSRGIPPADRGLGIFEEYWADRVAFGNPSYQLHPCHCSVRYARDSPKNSYCRPSGGWHAQRNKDGGYAHPFPVAKAKQLRVDNRVWNIPYAEIIKKGSLLEIAAGNCYTEFNRK